MNDCLTLGSLGALAVALCCPTQAIGEAAADKPASLYRPLTLAQADSASPAQGGESQPSNEQLARMVQNPLANLVSVPFQNNFNFGVGANNVLQYVVNFQPVIPFSLNENWNVITRSILPIMDTPSPAPGVRSAFGLGDLNSTWLVSPNTSGKFVCGLGPSMTFPTATDPLLGNGEFCAGAGFVVVYKPGHWVLGLLGYNVWSFAGWGNSDFSSMLVQPLVNYNFKQGWYLTMSPIITASWNASHDNVWTVPVGGGVGKVLRLGKLPVNVRMAAYYNVVTPKELGADWQFRFEFAFLFPKGFRR
jgi:hypothetical protein